MPKDYEDLFDIEDMDDEELKELVLQELEELPEIDVDLLEVEVEEGHVTISGRVGTEQELQAIEQLITDVLGIGEFSSGIVVDELVRAEYSEEVEEPAAEEELEVEDQLGEDVVTEEALPPGADHLGEDLEGDAYGTEDLQDAIEKGQAYSPPDRPVQMGIRSEENH